MERYKSQEIFDRRSDEEILRDQMELEAEIQRKEAEAKAKA
jgi:NADH dehydrogenase [ubiquinone] 1 alpha subcomplex assembly factor 7